MADTARDRQRAAEQAAGCQVDWTWLEGQEITAAWSDLQNLLIDLKDGRTLKVRALLYKGEPFLSFDPYYPPKTE
jgi:hypothetical protein